MRTWCVDRAADRPKIYVGYDQQMTLSTLALVCSSVRAVEILQAIQVIQVIQRNVKRGTADATRRPPMDLSSPLAGTTSVFSHVRTYIFYLVPRTGWQQVQTIKMGS